MTNQEFFEIVACFDRSTAQTMKLSTQEFTIELTRGGASAPAASACLLSESGGQSGCRPVGRFYQQCDFLPYPGNTSEVGGT